MINKIQAQKRPPPPLSEVMLSVGPSLIGIYPILLGELLSYLAFCMLINNKFISSIVSEDGASIYSASPEAAAELPSLDTSLKGAGK